MRLASRAAFCRMLRLYERRIAVNAGRGTVGLKSILDVKSLLKALEGRDSFGGSFIERAFKRRYFNVYCRGTFFLRHDKRTLQYAFGRGDLHAYIPVIP